MREVIAKRVRRQRRKLRIRGDIRGTAACPRLTVFRSARQIYAQLIDDVTGRTLCASSTKALELAYGGNVKAAKAVGDDLAAKAKALSLIKACFDRGPYRYHGRVKVVAEALRAAGLSL